MFFSISGAVLFAGNKYKDAEQGDSTNDCPAESWDRSRVCCRAVMADLERSCWNLKNLNFSLYGGSY